MKIRRRLLGSRRSIICQRGSKNRGSQDNRFSIMLGTNIPDVGDAPDFVEVGEAGIAMDDAMRRQRRVQLVG
jgi:hypothetical protein